VCANVISSDLGEPKTNKTMQSTFSTKFICTKLQKEQNGMAPIYCRITVAEEE